MKLSTLNWEMLLVLNRVVLDMCLFFYINIDKSDIKTYENIFQEVVKFYKIC